MSTDPVPEAPDPVRQLLHPPAIPARSLRAPHWAGIGGLAGAIVLAAIAIPPMISPAGERPAAFPAGATPPGTSSPPAEAGSPAAGAAPRPSLSPTAPPAEPGRLTAPTVPTGDPDTAAAPSPRGTPAGPTATVKRFTAVSVQAEDPGNLLADGAGVTSCATCEGGGRVRYLGKLTVYLDLPSAGSRTVTVTYESDGDRQIQVSTTDGRSWSFDTPGAGWETPRTFTFNAYLPAGRVALLFHNDNHPAADIDKVTIS
ncbi:hypothetical protein RB614_14495 [Phytohabitans sp. ZYX-F-186]|uniref:CBM6 domain-containing protein n=1 Tax=Phytohabitans maris TaxID=3071409 RepID=A0ABU0ZFA5_9ACTN|nr:hypothetical protein [Phytohabitans sp. ZYX-F-186]MDQ7905725.1 hypothetical protein [Phytohabitans sp. ZYX-F-186]